MRKFVALIFYLLMIAVGSWAIYHWLALGGKSIVLMGGASLAVFGVYLLWMDFVSPNREPL